jgi:hypothetical protein
MVDEEPQPAVPPGPEERPKKKKPPPTRDRGDLPNHPDLWSWRAIPALLLAGATGYGIAYLGQDNSAREELTRKDAAIAQARADQARIESDYADLLASRRCAPDTFRECRCGETQQGRQRCANGAFGECECQPFASVEPGCGPMPPYAAGFAQIRIAVGTRSQIAQRELDFREGLRRAGDEAYLPTLARVDGIQFDGTPGTILLINGVDERLGDALCGWLACKGWSPGRGKCELRVPSDEVTPTVADSDGDKVVDALDKCVKAPEDRRPPKPKDGCPDSDEDGISDQDDKCPDEKEDGQPPNTTDGCKTPCWDQAGYDGCKNFCDRKCAECGDNNGCRGAWCNSGEARIGCHRTCEGKKNAANSAGCFR